MTLLVEGPKKPTFIIIGSAKCGTTALASILDSHPDCCMSVPKEVSFFQDTIDFQVNPNYHEGWNWYQQAFCHCNSEAMVGEATPSYSDRSRSPNTARRIHDFNPDMKIVYMVRDPLDRQISGWRMQYAFGKEGSFPWRREHQWALKGFNYWMQMQRDVNQWDECRYGYQLEAYREFFPIDNILVSFLEDWRSSKETEVKRIMAFLGIDPSVWQPLISEKANRGEDRTIERRFWTKAMENPQIQKLSHRLPSSLRHWARINLARKRINYIQPDLSAAVRNEFVEYVYEDALNFLRSCGKNIDLWQLCKRKNEMAP